MLFDLYHPTFGKIFDIIGFIFIFLAIISNRNIYSKKLLLYKRNIFWLVPLFIVGFLSIFVSPATSASIILGFIILSIVPCYFESELNQNAIKFLTISQRLLFITQLIQLFIWIFTGSSIDFGGSLGFNTSRNFDGSFFRASGILAEANGMTVTQSLIFITLLKFRNKNADKLIFICSLLITFSLQGALIALITIFNFLFTNSSKEKSIIKFIFLLFITLLLISSAYDYIYIAYNAFSYRIEQFDQDQSLYYRILKPITIPYINLLIPHYFDILSAAEVGPGNAYFTGIYFFGIFFILFIFELIRKFTKVGLLPIIILLITLLSYQIYTTALFWVLLSIIDTKNKIDKKLNTLN